MNVTGICSVFMGAPLEESLHKLSEAVVRLERVLSKKNANEGEIFVFSEDKTPAVPIRASLDTKEVEERLDSIIKLLESMLNDE